MAPASREAKQPEPPTRLEKIETNLRHLDTALRKANHAGPVDLQGVDAGRAAGFGIRALALMQIETNELLRALVLMHMETNQLLGQLVKDAGGDTH
jgi:hypothetical protein